MKTIQFLFIILLMTGTIMPENPKDKKVFPYQYQKVNLDNGFKAILIPMEGTGLVAYYTVVRTGSRDEWEEGKSGFAHFFEHMMFRGTKRFPGNVYDSIVTSIGADANAYTSDDLTVYHMNFASEDLELVMDIESDRFRNLQYAEAAFQTESGAVYGEYRKNRTSPFSVAYEKLREVAFTKHTYKHTTIGFESDIKNMPNQFDYSLSFYQRYYRPENVVLVIAGNIDLKKTESMIKKYYSPWKSGYVAPKIDDEPEQNSFRSAEVEYDGKTLPLQMIGYKVDKFDLKNKLNTALYLFGELAFGETSEFYKKLVLDEQKVQRIYAGSSPTRDPYLFTISVMIKDEKDIEYVNAEIKSTIEKYKENLFAEKKLSDLVKGSKYSFLMNLDNPDAVASDLPQYITITGDIDVIDQFYNAMETITVQELQDAVKKYLVTDKCTTITLKGKK